jgi:hypothetical protein
MDKHGALLVADDVGNVVWRVSRAAHAPTAHEPGPPTSLKVAAVTLLPVR